MTEIIIDNVKAKLKFENNTIKSLLNIIECNLLRASSYRTRVKCHKAGQQTIRIN